MTRGSNTLARWFTQFPEEVFFSVIDWCFIRVLLVFALCGKWKGPIPKRRTDRLVKLNEGRNRLSRHLTCTILCFCVHMRNFPLLTEVANCKTKDAC